MKLRGGHAELHNAAFRLSCQTFQAPIPGRWRVSDRKKKTTPQIFVEKYKDIRVDDEENNEQVTWPLLSGNALETYTLR